MNRVGKHHVNMTGFLEVIQKEQNMSEIVMNQLKSGRADVIPKKRRKYAQYDELLKNIVELIVSMLLSIYVMYLILW